MTKSYPFARYFKVRASILVAASSLVFAGIPQMAQAAGLGRLVVFSTLGQPLRAEIEVTATRQELSDMKARLASSDTFKQIGRDYATSLLGVQFEIERRQEGKAIIKLTSDRPVNDPFLDMLLELTWSTGRLVREYSILLDPPEYTARTPGQVVAVAIPPVTPDVGADEGASVTAAPESAGAEGAESTENPEDIEGVEVRTETDSPDTEGSSSAISSEIRARALAQIQARQDYPHAGESLEVKRGDTLGRIAAKVASQGVSLDQMLIGLFRANPKAFNGNINRLRTGAILKVPDKSTFESISPKEARKIVLAQAEDWNAYRNKLAAIAAKSPARGDEAGQESSGQITAKVDDKAEPSASSDRLKVARAESASGTGTGKASEEDIIARDKALNEASERLAMLEKNVKDLQSLLELKNQQMADLQRQLAAKQTPQAVPAPQPVAQVQPPVPSAPPAAATQPVQAQPPVQPASPPPPPPPPAQPARRPAPPPPPPPEPDMLDMVMDNIEILGGAAGLLVLIGVYVFIRRRRAAAALSRDSGFDSLNSTMKSQNSSTSLAGNSVFSNAGFSNAGGQSVNTSLTDFSQAVPGSIDTDEVDPVAEADVYMAYGRDAQAEEILLDARQKDPKRTAIAVKLLEIYSGRKDAKQFSALATDLYSETGGVGADWEKAATMGRVLDPSNPLFRGGGPGAAKAGTAAANVDFNYGGSAPTSSSATAMSQPAAPALAPTSAATPAPTPAPTLAPTPEPAPVLAPVPLEFDSGKVPEPEIRPLASQAEFNAETSDLDFDISVVGDFPESESEGVAPDLDLGGDTLEPPEVSLAEPVLDDDGVEFDVSLTESTFLGRLPSEPQEPQKPQKPDLSLISLELDTPELDAVGEAQVATALNPDFATSQELVTATAVNPDFVTQQETATSINPDFVTAQEETATSINPDFVTQEETSTAVNPDFVTHEETVLIPPAKGEMSSDNSLDFEFGDSTMESSIILPNEEVATKLDLAKAYEEMGDIEGARELLQEVMAEGTPEQRETAQGLLMSVG